MCLLPVPCSDTDSERVEATVQGGRFLLTEECISVLGGPESKFIHPGPGIVNPSVVRVLRWRNFESAFRIVQTMICSSLWGASIKHSGQYYSGRSPPRPRDVSCWTGTRCIFAAFLVNYFAFVNNFYCLVFCYSTHVSVPLCTLMTALD